MDDNFARSDKRARDMALERFTNGVMIKKMSEFPPIELALDAARTVGFRSYACAPLWRLAF